KSYLENIDTIFTERISYRDKKIPFTKSINLKISDKYHLISELSKVKLNVEIQKLGEVILENVKVKVLNVPSYRKIVPLPSSVDLKIKGGTEILAKSTSEDFEVNIDFREYMPGRKISANVKTELKIKSIEINPNEFELIILRR
ncbi:MAG: hypothetical protein KAR38_07040, partial [Calditrichia bacterium]|nr:hypothetical protein [Calditrichia bacterium]